jgi:hypothetical protein
MSLLDLLKKVSNEGLKVPYLIDPVTKEPSVTLLFTYISFLVCLLSIIVLHFIPAVQSASITSISLFVICLIFYRLRKLDDVSINLKSGEVEIKSDDGDDNKSNGP